MFSRERGSFDQKGMGLIRSAGHRGGLGQAIRERQGLTAGGNIAGAGADILIFQCLTRPSGRFIKLRGKGGRGQHQLLTSTLEFDL